MSCDRSWACRAAVSTETINSPSSRSPGESLKSKLRTSVAPLWPRKRSFILAMEESHTRATLIAACGQSPLARVRVIASRIWASLGVPVGRSDRETCMSYGESSSIPLVYPSWLKLVAFGRLDPLHLLPTPIAWQIRSRPDPAHPSALVTWMATPWDTQLGHGRRCRDS